MLAEPLKSLGKKGKTLKIARNSLKRKKARKSKKARKRRLGLVGTVRPIALLFELGLYWAVVSHLFGRDFGHNR